MTALQPLPLPSGFPTEVFVVPGLRADLLPQGAWVLVGDEAIRPAWLAAGLPEPPGTVWTRLSEGNKRLATLEPWLETWAALPLHRDATLVAVGGGILTDLAGLAAALYLRGIRWHAWPTTLLSQVDAGLGGKTAVNLGAGKNLAGAFHPPERLVVTASVLETLPPRQVEAGFWEVFKMALVAGDLVWAEALLAMPRPDGPSMAQALTLKAGIVHRDLHERNERRLLNLGHTLGHALETAGGHALLHGEAVGLGTLAACLLAQAQGLPPFPEAFLEALTQRLAPLADHIPSWEACLPILARDKKAVHGPRGEACITCILPRPDAPSEQHPLPPEAWAQAHAGLVARLRGVPSRKQP